MPALPRPSLKARPARIRVGLYDDAPRNAVLLTLADWHSRSGAIVCGVAFLLFGAIDVSVMRGLSFRFDSVFDLVMMLAQGFWVAGWSVGVAVLLGLTLFFALGGAYARVTDRRLWYVVCVGPLRVVQEYDLREIQSLSVENDPKDPQLAKVMFRYGNGWPDLGNPVPREQAEALAAAIAEAVERVGGARPSEEVTAPAPSAALEVAEPLARGLTEGQRADSGRSARITLLFSNAVPLAGVLLLGWSLGEVMLLFWAENLVVGFYNVLKLVKVAKWGALFLAPFFVGHYGGFMTVHFLFVYYMFVHPGGLGGDVAGGLAALADAFVPLWPALLVMFISHGVSYGTNFLGQSEYEGRTAGQQMSEPYRRVVILHLTILFGGFSVLGLGQPLVALLLLVVLKTVVDFWAHGREHRR